MKQKMETSVRVNGQGNSRQKTLADALSSIEHTVLKNTDNILLHIEPKDITVTSAKVKTTTERFLFLFLSPPSVNISLLF
ncbi:MAG: DUF4312 family protein [Candidatus Phlomobacter fragariae]